MIRQTVAGASVLVVSLVLGSGALPVPAPSAPTTGLYGGHALAFRLPQLVDDRDDPNGLNLARHGARDAPLLLFLPGTGSTPPRYSSFLSAAWDAGYSVLGLDYVTTGRSLTRTCRAEPDCYDAFQRNRLDGSRPGRYSRVESENAILTRLRTALRVLEERDPRGDWGRFLPGGRIAWGHIVVAGHSQGGGEAAFIAHRVHVQGVLMFAAPVESFGGISAEWMGTPGRTPAARLYGLDSAHDMYASRIRPSWRALGMTGPVIAAGVPRGSHLLVTTLSLGSRRQAHGRVISDATPHSADGRPRLYRTWQWMLDSVR